MAKCIFCDIIGEEAPAARVYEDDLCLAFLDIHSLGRGHVLIVPKEHVQQITSLPQTVSDHLFHQARRVLEAQRQLGWGVDGTNILLNDGKTANQTLPHAHVHVIPRKKGDSLKSAGKLLLHVTGLFGFRTSASQLEHQAASLRALLANSN
jgi:histidine triad (HIT) family protein